MPTVRHVRSLPILGLLASVACNPTTGSPETPAFIDGRGVAYAGDTVFATTRSGLTGLVVHRREEGRVDTIGSEALSNPFHVQAVDGRWYVSDVQNDRATIVVLRATGTLERRIPVDTIAALPHQFAVLPDGRIILETPDGRLVALTDTGTETFAVTGQSDRPGLLLAARGGALHAAPGVALTLYNEFGNIRWRLRWPWHEGAFINDLAEDAQGRVHVLASEEHQNTFVVFSLSPLTGEVVRWSEPGPHATFLVDRIGTITPDTTGASSAR